MSLDKFALELLSDSDVTDFVKEATITGTLAETGAKLIRGGMANPTAAGAAIGGVAGFAKDPGYDQATGTRNSRLVNAGIGAGLGAAGGRLLKHELPALAKDKGFVGSSIKKTKDFANSQATKLEEIAAKAPKTASIEPIYLAALNLNMEKNANLGASLLRTAIRNPKATGAVAGGVMGAIQDPGTDPVTGQQKSRLGNIAMGAGLGAITGGAAKAGLQYASKQAPGTFLRSGADSVNKGIKDVLRKDPKAVKTVAQKPTQAATQAVAPNSVPQATPPPSTQGSIPAPNTAQPTNKLTPSQRMDRAAAKNAQLQQEATFRNRALQQQAQTIQNQPINSIKRGLGVGNSSVPNFQMQG